VAFIYLSDGNGHSVNLTPRQAHVLSYIRSGYTITATANELGISDETVKYHIEQVKNKAGVFEMRDLIEQVASLWSLTFGFSLLPRCFRLDDSRLVAGLINAGKEVVKQGGERGGTTVIICAILVLSLLRFSPISIPAAFAVTATPVDIGTPVPTITPIPLYYIAEVAAESHIATNMPLALAAIGFVLTAVMIRYVRRAMSL